jgi:hypothetical protein
MISSQFLLYNILAALFLIVSFCNISADPVLGIVALQKDEDSLSLWLEYHSKIVDVRNMIVLDNSSEDPRTIKILNTWTTKGLHVLYNQGPYEKKGELTSRTISLLAHVDIIIPLDLDEFLFAYDGEQPILSKHKILSTLNDFWNQQNYSCLGLQQFYSSAIMRANQTLETTEHFTKNVYDLKIAKKIGKTKEIVAFDHGNHNAFAKCPKPGHGTCKQNCTAGYGNLGLLHFHWVNPESVARRAVTVSIGRGFFPDNFTLEQAMANHELVFPMFNRSGVLQGGHKLRELWRYIKTGPTAFLAPTKQKFIVLDPLPEMIRKIEST